MINKNQIIAFVVSFLVGGFFIFTFLPLSPNAYAGNGGPVCCQGSIGGFECAATGPCSIADCPGSQSSPVCDGSNNGVPCECPPETCEITIEKSVNEPDNIEFFFEIVIGDGGPTIPFSLPKGDQFSTMFDIPVDGMQNPTTIRELTDQLPHFCEFIDIDCTTSESAECFDEEGPVIQCRCGSPEDEITCTFINNCNPPTIPTLNQWGKIITIAVMGLFAVIGLIIMRRRNEVKS